MAHSHEFMAPLADISEAVSFMRREAMLSKLALSSKSSVGRPVINKLEAGPCVWQNNTIVRFAEACGYDAHICFKPKRK